MRREAESADLVGVERRAVGALPRQSARVRRRSSAAALLLGLAAAPVLLLGAAPLAAAKTYILATGRRDPRIYAIDLEAALAPQNQNTARAIVSRAKVALERLDGTLLGDPANLLVSEDGETLYVANHHGSVASAEFTQHGGRGNIAVLDIAQLLAPEHDDSAAALRAHWDSGGFGAVGLLQLGELLIASSAEGQLSEDGGNRIQLIDRRTGSLRSQIELALGTRGGQGGCAGYPVPFASPAGPPPGLAVAAPDPSFGCFPNTNGLALGRAAEGGPLLFAANGGTDDVSVIDLERALAGERSAELARVPLQIGPWGIAASPDGRWIAAASRESQRRAAEGNTLSILSAERARAGAAGIEVARVRVGADSDDAPSRPFIPSFTPDGALIVVPCFRTDVVALVDLQKALVDPAAAEIARIPLRRPPDADGQQRPANPKGSAVSADGRYAVITGGARTPFAASGTVWIIDLAARAVVGTVTGVGNDPYAVALVER